MGFDVLVWPGHQGEVAEFDVAILRCVDPRLQHQTTMMHHIWADWTPTTGFCFERFSLNFDQNQGPGTGYVIFLEPQGLVKPSYCVCLLESAKKLLFDAFWPIARSVLVSTK